MPSYSAKIMLGDHPGDLHLHLFYNIRYSRKPIGKFRIPSLEPLPGINHNLTNKEYEFIKKWLNEEQQKIKLQHALKMTLFNSHQLGAKILENIKKGTIEKREGETFITIRIPVVERLK